MTRAMSSFLVGKLQPLFTKQFCYNIYIKHFSRRLFETRSAFDIDQKCPREVCAVSTLKACATV